MRILAVEDNQDLRNLLEEYLWTQDHEYVRTAASGKEALEVIHSAPVIFDCLLLDIQMPEMSGVELIPHIRQIDGYEFVPIIMLTGVKNSESIAKSFVAGAWDYIIKPFEFFDLEARIHGAEMRNAEFVRHLKRPHESPNQENFDVLKELALDRPMSPSELSESGLVPQDAFENCIMRMQSEFGGGMQIAVIVLQNFADVLSQVPQDQRVEFSVGLARRLTDALSSLNLIVTYRSNGTFAALSPALKTQSTLNIADVVKNAVQTSPEAACHRDIVVNVDYCRTKAFSTSGDTIVMLDQLAKRLSSVTA
ncbi:MAG: response regulator transcription factor [Sulfitobacter sp.]|nr:response regulator transcription factor [Sulfitobacter sp.]